MMCCYVSLKGHSSFITHLDWSKEGKHIMSNSGDYEILYCKLKKNISVAIYFKRSPSSRSSEVTGWFWSHQGTSQQGANC